MSVTRLGWVRKAGCLMLWLGLVGGCSLETGGIGGPEATDILPEGPSARPASGRDASTSSRTNDDATSRNNDDDAPAQTEPASKPDKGPLAADDIDQPEPSHDAGVSAPAMALHDGGLAPIATGDAATSNEPAFPAIMDPFQAGPYTPVSSAGENRTTVFSPSGFDSDTRIHPVVIWDNTAGITGPSGYQGMLQHLASHGFVVVATETSSVKGGEILAALAWIVAENARAKSPYFGKLDIRKIAAAGHGLGSIATFAAASDPRLSTTLHLSGATNAALGDGHLPIENLEHPTAFFCDTGGGNIFPGGDSAASCQADYDAAHAPIFFATIGGAEQINLPANVAGAIVGWLRWQLWGDVEMKKLFAEPTCKLCSRTNWSVQQRGLTALP